MSPANIIPGTALFALGCLVASRSLSASIEIMLAACIMVIMP